MRVWGTANFQGQPIEQGQIVFFPIEGTASPSTGGQITGGHYDIRKPDGPYVGGSYRVEITAYGPERTYIPNASGVGLTASVRNQLIPAAYNRESTLRMKISPNAEENQHDFDIP